MNILVTNREIAQDICSKANAPHLVISIYSTDGTPVEFTNNAARVACLSICFDDVWTEEMVCGGVTYYPLREEQAKQIWEFVDRYENQINFILVQCDGGVSRSPAIAAAIALDYGADDREFFNPQRFSTNLHVYYTMRKTRGL